MDLGSADPWKNAKKTFQDVIRKSVRAKQIISVNLYPTDVAEHYDLISELGILCRKHRNLKVSERENEFKAASLNPKHNKYYDPYEYFYEAITTVSMPTNSP